MYVYVLSGACIATQCPCTAPIGLVGSWILSSPRSLPHFPPHFYDLILNVFIILRGKYNIIQGAV